jgi:DNA uptake protein ComE-like DNA-binding protein
MTITHRTAGRTGSVISGGLVLLLMLTPPVGAQVSQLIDPNVATEGALQQLPNVTPVMVKNMLARRPFKTVVELNKFLLDQMLTQAQAQEFYRKAFIPINLNSGTKDEFLLIPGVGPRMSGEFQEYRPWKTWAQFDKEIGKYVGQQETDRLKQYFFIPPK